MKGNDLVKKAIIKQERLKGKSGKAALLAAGYAKNTAEHCVGETPLLKLVDAEIQADIKDKVTVEWIVGKLEHEANTAPNAADRIRATELLGKWRAMFTDKVKSDIELREDEIPERKHRLMDMVREITPQG